MDYFINEMEDIKSNIEAVNDSCNDKNIEELGNKTFYRIVINKVKGADIDAFADSFEGYAFTVQGMYYEKAIGTMYSFLEYYRQITDIFYDMMTGVKGYNDFYKTIKDMLVNPEEKEYAYYSFVNKCCSICEDICDRYVYRNNMYGNILKEKYEAVLKSIDALFLERTYPNRSKVYKRMNGISRDTTTEERELYITLHNNIKEMAESLYTFGTSLGRK